MAKCKQCGKRGFFLKLNENGICSDCIRINKLKEQETQLSLNIQKLDGTYSSLNKEFEHLKSNKEAYYGFMSISWTQFFSFFTNIFSQIL